jgi:hypothetical protein
MNVRITTADISATREKPRLSLAIWKTWRIKTSKKKKKDEKDFYIWIIETAFNKNHKIIPPSSSSITALPIPKINHNQLPKSNKQEESRERDN